MQDETRTDAIRTDASRTDELHTGVIVTDAVDDPTGELADGLCRPHLTDELLVEEVSIDGMCGVY